MARDPKNQTLHDEIRLLQVFKLIPAKVREKGEEAIVRFLQGAITRYMVYFYLILALALFVNLSLVIELFREGSFVFGDDPMSKRLTSFAATVIWLFLPFIWRERALRFKDLLQVLERTQPEA